MQVLSVQHSDDMTCHRGTWVLPVLANVEGKLGALVTMSCRLKLRPCSRLLADDAAHKHKDRESAGRHTHTHTNTDTGTRMTARSEGGRFRDSERQRWRSR